MKNISIGKGRRLTLSELFYIVSRDKNEEDDNDVTFDFVASAAEAAAAAASSSSSPPLNEEKVIEALTALTAANNNEHQKCVSSQTTLGALILLACNFAQGRLVAHTKEECDYLVSSLLQLIEIIRKPTSPALCLEPTAWWKSVSQDLLVDTNHQKEKLPCLLLQPDQFPLDDSIVARLILMAEVGASCAAARHLVQLALPIAALSLERWGVVGTTDGNSNNNVFVSDYYSEKRFDILRPHRGLVASASTLRAIVNGSRYVHAQEESSSTAAAAVPTEVLRNIPQYHGPAQETIASAYKTLELEMNCFELSSTDALDTTVAQLAYKQLYEAIQILLQASYQRQGKEVVTSEDSTSMEQVTNLLSATLKEEAQYNCEFITAQVTKSEEQAKEKEAAKEKAAAARSSGNNNHHKTNDGGADEFKGMSEEKKQKILKKRADKLAKAEAKKQAKAKKGFTLFGAGTQPICTILENDKFALSARCLEDIQAQIDSLLSGGVQRKPKLAKGTRDYLPEQMMIRQQAFDIIRRVFHAHGAVEIDTPVFELKDTLTGKYGEDSKLIYDLADQGGELLALRYDLTVPFARFLALNNVGNIKRFHIGKVYRRDQPVLSKGRYREFYQCDFDIAGQYGRMIPDAECVCVACDILDALPIGEFKIKLNHRRLLDAILDICGVPADKFRTICSAVDKLDKEPWENVKKEMVEEKGLREEVADKIGTFVLKRGEPMAMYAELIAANKFGKHAGAHTAMEDLRLLFEYLEAMDRLQFVSFDLSLARGLDYYTGVIYEAVCLSGNTQVGSIGGGGRYDNLVSMFQDSGKQTPCVGVSVGIERVFTLMEARMREEQGGTIKKPNVDIVVASAGEGMLKDRMRITKALWQANLSAEFNHQDNPKLKYELKNCLDRGIPFMVIVGEEELKEGNVKVKDLLQKTEETIAITDLVSTLRSKGVIPVGCEFAAEVLQK